MTDITEMADDTSIGLGYGTLHRFGGDHYAVTLSVKVCESREDNGEMEAAVAAIQEMADTVGRPIEVSGQDNETDWVLDVIEPQVQS